jgi:hypothetical protein
MTGSVGTKHELLCCPIVKPAEKEFVQQSLGVVRLCAPLPSQKMDFSDLVRESS